MKKFVKYVEVFVGSRGLLEGVGVMSFENIEDYLEFESNENKESAEEFNEFEDEEEKEELLRMWDWNKLSEGVYCLGLGDEEVKYYVSVESEKFKEWKKKNNVGSIEYGLNYLDSGVIKELLD